MSFDFLLLIFYFSENWYAAQVSPALAGTMLIFFQLLVQLSVLSFASADSSFVGMTTIFGRFLVPRNDNSIFGMTTA